MPTASSNNGYTNIVGGDFPLVTDRVLIKTGNLKAGTVLGSYGVSAGTKAKKSVTFSGTPVATKKVTVAVDGLEVEYTITSTTLNTEVAAIASAINDADSPLKGKFTATTSSAKLLIECDTKGREGNSMEIVVTVGDSGLTAGTVTEEVYGVGEGEELFQIVDSDSATSSLQNPVAVLLEDADASSDVVAAVAAFRGEFVGSKLIFDTGDSLSTFKLKLRKAGLYPKAAV